MRTTATGQDTPMIIVFLSLVAPKLGQIPELVTIILSHATKADCAHGARVCRLWNSVALDFVWQDLPEFSPLKRLLPGLNSDDADPAVVGRLFNVPKHTV